MKRTDHWLRFADAAAVAIAHIGRAVFGGQTLKIVLTRNHTRTVMVDIGAGFSGFAAVAVSLTIATAHRIEDVRAYIRLQSAFAGRPTSIVAQTHFVGFAFGVVDALRRARRQRTGEVHLHQPVIHEIDIAVAV